MRNHRVLSLCGSSLMLLLGVLLTPATLGAQDKEGLNANGTVDAQSAAAAGVGSVSLARQLVRYGMVNGNPEALVLAAEILLAVGARELGVEKKQEGVGGGEPPAEGATEMMPSALIAAAREMAEPGAPAIQMIEEIESRPVEHGAVARPKVASECALAGMSDFYMVSFPAREDAFVTLIGDGDTDLDLFIYDENGLLVASDTGFSDYARVAWRPIWSGAFVIKVENLGAVNNCYGLATN